MGSGNESEILMVRLPDSYDAKIAKKLSFLDILAYGLLAELQARMLILHHNYQVSLMLINQAFESNEDSL